MVSQQDWESADVAGWQFFDLEPHLDAEQYVTLVNLVIRGTGSGAPGFDMVDARIVGTPIENPSENFYVRVSDGGKFVLDSF